MNERNLQTLEPLFYDEEIARGYIERLRWPDGPVCPHCEAPGAYRLVAREGSTRPVRAGVYKCRPCRKQFTVTVGTIFENSHIPLHVWLHAFYLLCASKKGMSAHQLHRMLGVTYKSAWFMAHRIRYAMGQPAFATLLSGIVEVDETYVGPKNVPGKRGRGAGRKQPVVTLVERDGDARSYHIANITGETLRGAIDANVSVSARVMTDSYPSYRGVRKTHASHETVDHGAREYARGDVHVNTAEGFFSILKRGIYGTYQHVSPAHLHRYLAEFDFRYNRRKMSDANRFEAALRHVTGKRLMYADWR
jgi:transposase-like protein